MKHDNRAINPRTGYLPPSTPEEIAAVHRRIDALYGDGRKEREEQVKEEGEEEQPR